MRKKKSVKKKNKIKIGSRAKHITTAKPDCNTLRETLFFLPSPPLLPFNPNTSLPLYPPVARQLPTHIPLPASEELCRAAI